MNIHIHCKGSRNYDLIYCKTTYQLTEGKVVHTPSVSWQKAGKLHLKCGTEVSESYSKYGINIPNLGT